MNANKIQLFVINEDHNSICYEKCKICVNTITKQLIVTPSNKDVKPVVLDFDRTFHFQANILGIFDNTINDQNNYLLILPSSKICQIIFNKIQIEINESTAFTNDENKAKFSAFLKLVNVESCEGSKATTKNNHISLSVENEPDKDPRKRRLHRSSITRNKITEASKFKIISNIMDEPSKLIIFPSYDKSQCYEYSWNNGTKLYNCFGCLRHKRSISARICKNLKGKDYVQLLATKHVCEMRKYNPEKFDTSRRIFDNTNYQIFNYNQNGKSKSTLVFFCPTNKKLCYEYVWHNSERNYACGGCCVQRRVTAVICQDKDGKEFVKLSKGQHVCDLREVDFTKFKDDLMIQKPMYEFIERMICGIKKRFLLIFVDDEKEYCYKFSYAFTRNGFKTFYCQKCGYRGINIRAFVNNENGDECVYVKDKQHICTPVEYSSLVKNNIVEAPNFQLLKRKVNGKLVQHLVVFINDDKTKCYEYTWYEFSKKYICQACRKAKAHVYARLQETKKDGAFVELCQIQHKCTPISFVPEISIKFIYEPNFKVEEYTLGGIHRKRIIIYDEEDKSLCYFYYKEVRKIRKNNYYCAGCSAKHKYVTMKLLQNPDGQNYLELNNTQHVCDPQKQTTITTVRKPNYKLEECTIDGFKRKFVIIFEQNDKTICYKYRYYGTDKAYLCISCKNMDVFVTARLRKDKDGEEYVALNKNQHVCNPVKYNSAEFSTKILTSINFKFESITRNGVEEKQLIVNSTTNKDKYFIYFYSSKNDIFFCKECNDKYVNAKLQKDGNGEDYLQMGSKKHSRNCRALTKS